MRNESSDFYKWWVKQLPKIIEHSNIIFQLRAICIFSILCSFKPSTLLCRCSAFGRSTTQSRFTCIGRDVIVYFDTGAENDKAV